MLPSVYSEITFVILTSMSHTFSLNLQKPLSWH